MVQRLIEQTKQWSGMGRRGGEGPDGRGEDLGEGNQREGGRGKWRGKKVVREVEGKRKEIM